MNNKSKNVSRREFLKTVGKYSLVLAVSQILDYKIIPPIFADNKSTPPAKLDLVIVKNSDPETLVRKNIELLGGMKKFVSNGDIVIIKPNIGFDRAPELACTTNPTVVSTLVKLAYESGAKKVKVFDNPCGHPKYCYQNSGIDAAARKAGAEVKFVNEKSFVKTSIPQGVGLKEWPILRDVLECDCLINVPIAKVHSLTGVTLGIKNWLGVAGGNRGIFHLQMDRWLADLATLMKPKLTVIDAVRIRLRSGPSGGKIEDVKKLDTVIASTDPVAVDSYATTLFGKKGTDIGYIRNAAELGLGQIDWQKLKYKEVSLKS